MPWHAKLIWFGILASVDDFGLCEWSPLRIGQVFMEEEINKRQISVKTIEETMDGFANLEDPPILTWSNDGFRYIATVKHQDYQRVNGPSNADCPFPPRETFVKLSGKTQALLCKGFAKFTSYTEPDIRDFLAKAGDIEEEGELELEDELEIALRAAHSRIKDLYSNLYRGRTGEKPLMTAPDFSLLKTRLHEVATDVPPKEAEQKVTAVIRHALSGDYRDFQSNLPPLQTVLSKYHWNRIVSGLAIGAKR